MLSLAANLDHLLEFAIANITVYDSATGQYITDTAQLDFSFIFWSAPNNTCILRHLLFFFFLLLLRDIFDNPARLIRDTHDCAPKDSTSWGLE